MDRIDQKNPLIPYEPDFIEKHEKSRSIRSPDHPMDQNTFIVEKVLIVK